MLIDLIAEDREGRPVLMGDVQARSIRDVDFAYFLGNLEEMPESIAFGLHADPKSIRIVRRGESEPAATFDAIEVLGHYAPDYTGEPTPDPGSLAGYALALIVAWLRDLAYGWKREIPPKRAELDRIGLLKMLEGGTTVEEVAIGGGALR